MKYDIQAIETVYKGITFRSRLEATWAAMFDLLGWRWEYECDPINGWLPDFLISAKYPADHIPVEVKPIFDLDYHVGMKIAGATRKGLPDQAEPLIVGHGPTDDFVVGFCRIGHLYQWSETDGGCGVCWEPAGILIDGGELSLSTSLDDSYPREHFVSRMTGRRISWRDAQWLPKDRVFQYWGAAKKTVRYRPR